MARSSCKSLSIALLAGLALWLAPMAAFAGNEQLLEAAENKLLGHSNSSLAEGERLNQLETALYGKPKKGDPEKRLETVADLLGVKAGHAEAKPVEQATLPLQGSVSESRMAEARGLMAKGLEENAQGRFADAERNFNLAIGIDKNNPDGYFNLGALAEKRGDARQALNYYETALRLSPHDPELQSAVQAMQARLDVTQGQPPVAAVNDRGWPEKSVSQNPPPQRTFNLSSTKNGAVTGVAATTAQPKAQGFGGALKTVAGVAMRTPLHCPMCEVLTLTRLLRF